MNEVQDLINDFNKKVDEKLKEKRRRINDNIILL